MTSARFSWSLANRTWCSTAVLWSPLLSRSISTSASAFSLVLNFSASSVSRLETMVLVSQAAAANNIPWPPIVVTTSCQLIVIGVWLVRTREIGALLALPIFLVFLTFVLGVIAEYSVPLSTFAYFLAVFVRVLCVWTEYSFALACFTNLL